MTGVAEMVDGATTTLLCGASLGGETQECCEELLTAGADDGREVLWVTYTRPPADCVASVPEDVSVRGVPLSATRPTGRRPSTASTSRWWPPPETSPRWGIKLSRFLSAGDDDLTVCF